MSRADKLALLLSLLAVLAAYLVTTQVFESMPHIEDEMAYVWQAEVLAEGHLTTPSPPHPKSFLVPFVVDLDGQRFSKYPLGWPALLAAGVALGVRGLVNPLLAGLAVWLTYLLGKRVFSEAVGLLAAFLTLISPFFLMLSGSLLSHSFGLVLSAAFALTWLDSFCPEQEPPSPRRAWLAAVVAGLLLGLLAHTRPLTAVGVALPFAVHGLYLLVKGNGNTRWRVLTTGAITLALALLLFAWQYALTGDALTNPYTLWWTYDKVGFGEGYGRYGHSLTLAWSNLKVSLRAGVSDLFGWAKLSWLFLPFGLWAIRRDRLGWLLSSVFFSLVLVHLAYWIGSWLFGPRYYFEGLYSLTLLTAAGIAWLAGWPLKRGDEWPRPERRRKVRPLLVTALVTLLVASNLLLYLPTRLVSMHGLYGIERAQLVPFQTPEAQALTPALIIVHPDPWTDYGGLLELQNATLDSPFIFAISRRGDNAALAALYADAGRAVYHYYPDEPGRFYISPRTTP